MRWWEPRPSPAGTVDGQRGALDRRRRHALGGRHRRQPRRSVTTRRCTPSPSPVGGGPTVAATRYPVTYEGGPAGRRGAADRAEDGRQVPGQQGFLAGEVFALPDPLGPGGNVAERVAGAPACRHRRRVHPRWRTRVLLRTYADVREVDPGDWERDRRSIATPPVKQGETLAAESGGRTFLIGSEGESSPLIRVAIPTRTEPAPTATPSPTPSPFRSTTTAIHAPRRASRVAPGSAPGSDCSACVAIGWWVARGRLTRGLGGFLQRCRRRRTT